MYLDGDACVGSTDSNILLAIWHRKLMLMGFVSIIWYFHGIWQNAGIAQEALNMCQASCLPGLTLGNAINGPKHPQ